MLGDLAIEEHHDAMVCVNTLTERLRRSECLCLNCINLKDCNYAQQLFELCRKGYVALMVTRCLGYHE